MKHVAGFANEAGTRIAAAALSRVQFRRSGVTVVEQIRTRAVSIVHPFLASPKSDDARVSRISS